MYKFTFYLYLYLYLYLYISLYICIYIYICEYTKLINYRSNPMVRPHYGVRRFGETRRANTYTYGIHTLDTCVGYSARSSRIVLIQCAACCWVPLVCFLGPVRSFMAAFD